MVIRVAFRILSPHAYARGNPIAPPARRVLGSAVLSGASDVSVASVEQGEGEPILRVRICEGNFEDAHLGRPFDVLHDLLVPCPPEWLRIEIAGPVSRKKDKEPGLL